MFDYAFVGDKGDISSQEQAETEEGSVTVLTARDSQSKAVFGHVVPKKGIDEKGFAVDAIIEDVKWLGYTKTILKTDNEPAILKLLVESLEGAEDSGHGESDERELP